MKFTASQNVTKPVVLSGAVKKISTAPVNNKSGTYYQCTAKIKVPKIEKGQVKYGLNGRVVITKGQKSWFNYYKNNFLGDRNG